MQDRGCFWGGLDTQMHTIVFFYWYYFVLTVLFCIFLFHKYTIIFSSGILMLENLCYYNQASVGKSSISITSFHATGLLLYPMKTSETYRLWFRDVFRGFRRQPVAWNRLKMVSELSCKLLAKLSQDFHERKIKRNVNMALKVK